MYQIYYFFHNIMIFVLGVTTMLFGSVNRQDVKMIAHTGLSTEHLENTVEAFMGAIENGSDGIETDIRITGDGELVCWHDSTVKFADGTVLEVEKATLAELQEKPIKNWTCDEEAYICSFERYLEICKEYNMICFLDLKSDFSSTERVKLLFDTVDKVYDRSMVIPQSSGYEDLIPIRELYPDQKIMLCLGRLGFEDGVDYKRCFDYNFDIDADYTVMNKKIVKEFHDRGLEVGVFTCNSKLTLSYAHSIGVDYVESDCFG